MQIDKHLIQSCIRQNRQAQKRLYELLLPYLRAIANRYLRDPSYSKDVLQESFVKIFKNIKTYQSTKGSFNQWAAKIVINTSFNFNQRIIGLPNEELKVIKHDVAINPSTLHLISDERLLSILKQMPSAYYEVFNLYIIDGYDHTEIAEMLGISVVLSRQRLSRAKNWLKKNFDKNPHLINDLVRSKKISN